MKRCVFCNSDNNENALFCNSCGHRFDNYSKETNSKNHNPESLSVTKEGYLFLEEYNEVLYNTSIRAEQLIRTMPHQAIKKVFSILETLVRDYYSEIIICNNSFSREELIKNNTHVQTKDNISEIIEQLSDEHLISDDIKNTLLYIKNIRNEIDYGQEADIQNIDEQTAQKIYESGKMTAYYFLNGIDSISLRNFAELKQTYPYLYRKADDASNLLKEGDFLATIDELGNLLRGLCCELYAQYMNIKTVRSVKYKDAITVLSNYKLVNKDALETISDIVHKRNHHHNLKSEIDAEYTKSAYKLSGKLTIYILELISNSGKVREQTVCHNTVEYEKIIKYLSVNYNMVFSSKFIYILEDTNRYWETDKYICKCYCNNIKPEINSEAIYYRANESIAVYCMYPELYTFADYIKEHYVNYNSYINQLEPMTDCIGFYFSVNKLIENQTISNLYNQYKNELVIKEEQARQKKLFEEEQAKQRRIQFEKEQKRRAEEAIAIRRAQAKRRIDINLISALVPVGFSLFIILGIIVSEIIVGFSINLSYILWATLPYIAIIILSHHLKCLGVSRIIWGGILCFFTKWFCVCRGSVDYFYRGFPVFGVSWYFGIIGLIVLCIWAICLWVKFCKNNVLINKFLDFFSSKFTHK